MVNTVAKGNRYERMCLEEAIEHFVKPESELLSHWHASRTRFGGNDFVQDFDLALYLLEDKKNHSQQPRKLHLIQVKSKFERAYYDGLCSKYRLAPFTAHLAVYGQKKASKVECEVIKLKHFNLYRVC